MKRLRFSEPLPHLIVSGHKDITWRIDDDKNITVGYQLSLCDHNGRQFAKAQVIGVKETTFEHLTEEDKKGHEQFSSDEEMYRTYSRYYNMNVTPHTRVKIIKFRLLSLDSE